MSELERRHVADAAAYFDRWLEFRLTADRVPGVQAAVLCDNEVVLSAAHGIADVKTGEPLTDRHLFRIASHSKTFTATAVMQLVEGCELRLDDTVGERLVELAPSPITTVTVRELFSHPGGVVRDGWDGDFWQLDRAFPDRAELLRIAADDSAVLGRNERFKYSNVGYSLLGLIVEQVSGTPFRDYVIEHVIGPLGLTDTGPDLDEARRGDYAGGHAALAYANTRIPIDHIDTGAMSAATGLYSTASDLAHSPRPTSRATTGSSAGCETPDAARRMEDRRHRIRVRARFQDRHHRRPTPARSRWRLPGSHHPYLFRSEGPAGGVRVHQRHRRPGTRHGDPAVKLVDLAPAANPILQQQVPTPSTWRPSVGGSPRCGASTTSRYSGVGSTNFRRASSIRRLRPPDSTWSTPTRCASPIRPATDRVEK